MTYFLLLLCFVTLLGHSTCNQDYVIYHSSQVRQQGFHPITRREMEEIRSICGRSRVEEESDDEDDEDDEAVEGSADDEKRRKRSTGGQLAEHSQFPWAGILIRPNDYRFCSLSLISRRHAITAGHCMLNDTHQIINHFLRGNVVVGYGGNCHYGLNVVEGLRDECDESNMKLKKAARLAMIPSYIAKYAPGRAVDDIAIIELEEDIKDASFIPSCLPHATSPLPAVGAFSGFGRTKDGRYRPQLRYVTGVISNRPSKQFLYFQSNTTFDDPNLEKYGLKATTEASHKKGDSGCGMVGWPTGSDRAVQFGVMHGGFPGIATFVDVRRYAQWICGVTGVCN